MTNNFIYSDPNKIQNSNKLDMFYSMIDDYDFMDDDNNPRINQENDRRVLAKVKIKNSGQEKFLIKLDNTKKLFNPSSPLSENRSDKLLNQYQSEQSNFKEVSKTVFDLYLTFLRTSNPSWIHNAEREAY